MAVITTSTTAIITYWRGCGCRCSISTTSPCSTPTSSPPLPESSSPVVMRGTSSAVGNQVHDRENHDPDDVDEVPVEAGHFDRLGVLGGQLALHRPLIKREEPEDPDRDVGAVQTGHHEERAAERAGRELQAL